MPDITPEEQAALIEQGKDLMFQRARRAIGQIDVVLKYDALLVSQQIPSVLTFDGQTALFRAIRALEDVAKRASTWELS